MLAALTLSAVLLTGWADRPDVVVADFEGETYGDWVFTGTAFGQGPARGTLPGQMEVTGFLGQGLVNSFHGGDGSTGTLASPEFVIERDYLNFLIGGGAYEGKTCLQLSIGGVVVRTATGPNDKPGGSERLAWNSWDVGAFQGKPARLQIVDAATGGWGHVNVDQITLSDTRRGDTPRSREMIVEKRYLQLPVANSAPARRIKVTADGRTLDEFETKLAERDPDFWVFIDLASHVGESIRVEGTLPIGSKALETLRVSESAVPDPDRLYQEVDRPQFHFTSRRGWLNDPNGLVYFEGEYHLYYQHNPYGWDWGNMHWGHAVSRDLVHWTELPIAIYPKSFGDWAFSGSAVVDARNTSGFGTADAPALVAAYTSTGRGECIVYSNDRGRTWTEYEGNPVVKHKGRDPRLLWHEPTRRWVMAVYDEEAGARDVAFHTSEDLRSWTYQSKISGFFECPDLFESPVEAEPGQTRWVLYGADGEYLLGRFDGKTFLPDEPSRKRKLWHGDFYAAQTFSDTPDGRRIQIGWGRGVTFPGMPFNQQMVVPCALTLRRAPEGLRLFANPVKELQAIVGEARTWSDLTEKNPGAEPLKGLKGDLLQVQLDVEVADAGTVTLDVRGTPITYDAARRTLRCGEHVAPLAPRGGAIRLQILIDRGSIEVFGDDGGVAISSAFRPRPDAETLALAMKGPGVRVRTIKVSPLRSTWKTSSRNDASPR
ncbi:MAG: glycoside hydrolase family 32 protein [Isosphaeraceae bacterium]